MIRIVLLLLQREIKEETNKKSFRKEGEKKEKRRKNNKDLSPSSDFFLLQSEPSPTATENLNCINYNQQESR